MNIIRKKNIIGFLFLLLCYNSSYSVKRNKIVTRDEYLEKVYKDTIEEDELTEFAHQLLQARIDHWQQTLADAQEKNDKEMLDNIPLYIYLKPTIEPRDVLEKCRMSKNIDSLGFTFFNYKDLLIVEMSEEIRKNIIYFLNILHHELTHVEQCANWLVLRERFGAEKFSERQFYTNREAHQLYRSCLKKESISKKGNEVKSEFEADKGGICFLHNPYMLNRDIIDNKESYYFSEELSMAGYFSLRQTKAYLIKCINSHYKNNAKKLERHKEEYEKWSSLYSKYKRKNNLKSNPMFRIKI